MLRRRQVLGLTLLGMVHGLGCGGSAATGTTEPMAPAAAPGTSPARLPDTVEGAVGAETRTPANRARDRYRHPVETLTFFGVESDQVVVELWPGRGWYTEILAPLLRGRGKLSVVAPLPGTVPPAAPTHETIRAFAATNPAIYDRMEVVAVNPLAQPKFGEPGSADVVLTFRNAHNWMKDGCADEMFRAAFDVLRPGGTFGVVDHRGKEGMSAEEIAKSGYIPESTIIALAKTAGFELDGRSEVNANPKDTKDYAAGVWTLPPALRLGDEDRAKYQGIGESDRMTLRFRKPAKQKQKQSLIDRERSKDQPI